MKPDRTSSDQTRSDIHPKTSSEASESNIAKASLLGLVASVASLASGVIRNKVLALVLGPTGVGTVAEVLQLTTLGQVPVAALTGSALTRGVVHAEKHGGLGRTVGMALTGAVTVSLLGGLLATLAGFWLLPDTWAAGAWRWAILGSAGATFLACTAVATQSLIATGNLRDSTLIAIVSSIATAALVSGATWSFGLNGQFVAIPVAAAVVLPLAYRRLQRRFPDESFRPNVSVDLGFLRQALSLGGASLIGGAALQLALFVVRWSLERNGGSELNGYFQASWAIGSLYLGVLLTSLGTFVFPRFAAAASTEQLQSEVEVAGRFVLRFAPPIILAAIALREPLLALLYSSEFIAASELLGLHLGADMLKVMGWVYAGPLLYRGKARSFLITEGTASVVFGGISYVAIPHIGLNGAGWAYLIMYTAYLPLAMWVLRASCGVAPNLKRLLACFAVTATGMLCIHLSKGSWLGSGAILLVALIIAFANGSVRTGTQLIISKLRGRRT